MHIEPVQQIKETVERIEAEMAVVARKADSFLEPVRQTAFRRFPTLFLLLTTAGASITVLAIGKIVEQYDLFNQHPWFMLLLGIGILVVTGSLYKKLG